MANSLYGLGRQALLDGSVVPTTDTLKAALVTSGYTVNLSTDEFLSDIPGGDIVATSGALSSKSATLGVFNAANITFTAVSGSAAAYLCIFKDTGTPSTSRLLVYIDTGTGLPVTPNGGDISVAWDTGANKIFKI